MESKKQLTPLGKHLKKLFIELDLNIKHAAYRIGISPGYLSNICYGRNKVPRDFYRAVCLGLKLTPEQRVDVLLPKEAFLEGSKVG
jgi:plasmid maintenance system antidote protein VapI